MITLKLSASIIEQYRLVREGKYNLSTKDLVDYFTKAYVKSEAASRGSAYHQILEHGPERFLFVWFWSDSAKTKGRWIRPEEADQLAGKISEKRFEGPYYVITDKEMTPPKTWYFSQAAGAPAVALRDRYQDMTHETWVDYNTESNGYAVKLRIRADGLDGSEMHEFKTTGRRKKYSDYWESLQWRCYLAALPEVNAVNYHVFQLNTKNTACQYYTYQYLREEDDDRILREAIDGLVYFLTLRPELLELRIMTRDRNPLPF